MLPPIIGVETWKEYIVFCYAKKTAISTLDQGVHRGPYPDLQHLSGSITRRVLPFGEVGGKFCS